MSILDRLGLGPKREAVQQPDGTWKVTVSPPPNTGLSQSSIVLDVDQYRRYLEWRDGHRLIQECLPDLSATQREILMTGIGPEEFAKLAEEDEEDPE